MLPTGICNSEVCVSSLYNCWHAPNEIWYTYLVCHYWTKGDCNYHHSRNLKFPHLCYRLCDWREIDCCWCAEFIWRKHQNTRRNTRYNRCCRCNSTPDCGVNQNCGVSAGSNFSAGTWAIPTLAAPFAYPKVVDSRRWGTTSPVNHWWGNP